MKNIFTSEQEEWLVKLETTDKLQGTKYLKKDNKYCCLGIACELNNELVFNSILGKFIAKGTLYESFISNKLKEKLHLYSIEGTANTIRGMSLAELNDSGDYTFKEIAAIIRKNPSHYFINFQS